MPAAAAAPAGSQAPSWPWLDEIRLGVFAHDVRFAGGVEHGSDINLEALAASPFRPPPGYPAPLRDLLTSHPAVGVDVNTAGETSQLYFESVWQFNAPLPTSSAAVHPDQPAFFFDLGLGGAVNNGTRHSADPVRKSLGSHLLFHVSGEIGFRVTRHVAVSVDFNHSSNAGLSRYNQSINDAGVRLGWRF